MSDIAIQVEGISKQYRLGVISRKTLQDEVRFAWHRLLGRDPRLHMGTLTHGSSQQAGSGDSDDGERSFWALKDISFNVQAGETVGIIGRNGAGKTTLLKVLSRITEPTSGQAVIEGRMGSLLEVGTGFHPEMTGRENIFLNGSILGMRKAEIQKKYDDIVAFSEIGRFMDTPVKRYSSGMYVRLAFSVAAHLEPEILMIDEVLAVGDAGFQRKCLGKMGDVASEGRTILFVSHNMPAIQQLCSRCIVIEGGRVFFDGPTVDGIRAYMGLVGEKAQIRVGDRQDRKGNGRLRFTEVTFHHDDGTPSDAMFSGDNVRIRLHYRAEQKIENADVHVSFNIYNIHGVLLANLNSHDSENKTMTIYPQGFFECRWPAFNLRGGVYSSTIYCKVNNEVVDWIKGAFKLHAEDGDFFGTGKLTARNAGDILIKNSWQSISAAD
jgi:lipopolysaccharide transport system ATP-binding protein